MLTRMLEMSVVPKFTIDQCNLRAMPFELTFYQEISNETCYIKRAISHFVFMHACKYNRVLRGDREPSRVPEPTLNWLRNKTSILKEFVYERIRPSIPKSSWLRCCVNWLEKF